MPKEKRIEAVGCTIVVVVVGAVRAMKPSRKEMPLHPLRPPVVQMELREVLVRRLRGTDPSPPSRRSKKPERASRM